jgi:hypothetical protein
VAAFVGEPDRQILKVYRCGSLCKALHSEEGF